MRILHLINSDAKGGRELYVRDLILNLHKAGVENIVYCRKNTVISEAMEEQGIKCFYFEKKGKQSFGVISRMKKELKALGITHIHSHSNNDVWTGSLLKKALRAGHINSVYMGAGKKRDIIHRFIYGRVDKVITSSMFSKAELARNYPLSYEKIALIRYGREQSLFIPDSQVRQEVRTKLGTGQEKIVFGMMSRIDRGKGVQDVIEAIPLLKSEILEKVVFWIMGEPTIDSILPDGTIIYEKQGQELLDYIRNFIAEHKLENCVRLIGFDRQYHRYLNGMDVFILSTFNEMYSLSVIDAMFMGMPVIGTDAGGTTEQIGIDDERGILVPPQNPQKIAEAVTSFITNPQTIRQKGDAAKTWAKAEHDFDKAVREVVEQYRVSVQQY